MRTRAIGSESSLRPHPLRSDSCSHVGGKMSRKMSRSENADGVGQISGAATPGEASESGESESRFRSLGLDRRNFTPLAPAMARERHAPATARRPCADWTLGCAVARPRKGRQRGSPERESSPSGWTRRAAPALSTRRPPGEHPGLPAGRPPALPPCARCRTQRASTGLSRPGNADTSAARTDSVANVASLPTHHATYARSSVARVRLHADLFRSTLPGATERSHCLG
jgi:hypothetical protein